MTYAASDTASKLVKKYANSKEYFTSFDKVEKI